MTLGGLLLLLFTANVLTFGSGRVMVPILERALVQDSGALSLDQPVNERLRSWRVPENEFTVARPVTLRALLSHTAGLTIHGFPGYLVDRPIPTLPQILDGEAPANTGPVRVNGCRTGGRSIWPNASIKVSSD